MGDFPGLCKILHETTLLGTRREVHGMPCRAYLSFFYFCRYRFVLAVLWVEAIGRRWSLMDLILHDGSDGIFNVGLPVDKSVILSMSVGRDPRHPRVQAVGYCDRKRVRFAVKTSGLGPQALRWTISIPYHQQHVFYGLEFTSWSAWASWSAWM